MKKFIILLTVFLVLCISQFAVFAQDQFSESILDPIILDESIPQNDFLNAQATTQTATFKIQRLYSWVQPELNLINQERKNQDRQPVSIDKDLTEAAMIRAGELAIYFSHTRPDGELCFTVNEKAYGENIAIGYQTVDEAMKAWMDSQGHKENILDSDWSSIGIGIAKANDTYLWVQLFSPYTSDSTAVKSSNETIAQKIENFKSEYLVKASIEASDSVVILDETLTVNLVASINNGVDPNLIPLIPNNAQSSDKSILSATMPSKTNTEVLLKGLKEGSSKLTITSGTVSATSTFTVEENTVEIYRLYNPKNGEHLYTPDFNEAWSLSFKDWEFEGVSWNAPEKGVGVYRLYSPVTGVHLYTTDLNEVNTLKASGWIVDNGGQPLFYSGGNQPVYRLYNEALRLHLLTLDKNEYNELGKAGWTQEGVKLNAK